jgi:hypothetical protein
VLFVLAQILHQFQGLVGLYARSASIDGVLPIFRHDIQRGPERQHVFQKTGASVDHDLVEHVCSFQCRNKICGSDFLAVDVEPVLAVSQVQSFFKGWTFVPANCEPNFAPASNSQIWSNAIARTRPLPFVVRSTVASCIKTSLTRPASEVPLIAPKLGLVSEPLGFAELSVIPGVIELAAKLQLDSFSDHENALQRQIPVVETRPVRRKSWRVAQRELRSFRKGTRIEPMGEGLSAGEYRIANRVGTLRLREPVRIIRLGNGSG